MKITETVSRECCQQKDLRAVEGTPMRGRYPEWVFCIHCGRRHYYDSFMDAAGSRDWEYKPAKNQWESA